MKYFMHINSTFPLPRAWLKNPTYITIRLLRKQSKGNNTVWQLLFQDPLDGDPPSVVCSICYDNPALLSDLLQTLLFIRVTAHLSPKSARVRAFDGLTFSYPYQYVQITSAFEAGTAYSINTDQSGVSILY